MAKAKGMPTTRILVRHALRPSSLNLLTTVGLNFGNLIAGTVVIEVIFNIQGLGTLLTTAVAQRTSSSSRGDRRRGHLLRRHQLRDHDIAAAETGISVAEMTGTPRSIIRVGTTHLARPRLARHRPSLNQLSGSAPASLSAPPVRQNGRSLPLKKPTFKFPEEPAVSRHGSCSSSSFSSKHPAQPASAQVGTASAPQRPSYSATLGWLVSENHGTKSASLGPPPLDRQYSGAELRQDPWRSSIFLQHFPPLNTGFSHPPRQQQQDPDSPLAFINQTLRADRLQHLAHIHQEQLTFTFCGGHPASRHPGFQLTPVHHKILPNARHRKPHGPNTHSCPTM